MPADTFNIRKMPTISMVFYLFSTMCKIQLLPIPPYEAQYPPWLHVPLPRLETVM
jgi:hypothetical protein